MFCEGNYVSRPERIQLVHFRFRSGSFGQWRVLFVEKVNPFVWRSPKNGPGPQKWSKVFHPLGSGWIAQIPKGHFHLLKNMFFLPLLVSKGIYHYWTEFPFFPGVLTKWKEMVPILLDLSVYWR